VSLERRTSRGGKDSIDHPPGGHDDLANAAAGALVIAASASDRKSAAAIKIETTSGYSPSATSTQEANHGKADKDRPDRQRGRYGGSSGPTADPQAARQRRPTSTGGDREAAAEEHLGEAAAPAGGKAGAPKMTSPAILAWLSTIEKRARINKVFAQLPRTTRGLSTAAPRPPTKAAQPLTREARVPRPPQTVIARAPAPTPEPADVELRRLRRSLDEAREGLKELGTLRREIAALKAAVTRPRKIVRDAQGRATGVRFAQDGELDG
jgi:hypothetical protein